MLIGILGIIATIIIGIIPLLISLKEKTIRYWHVETESIFSQNIKEIKELKVVYNNEEINDNLIILKTVIENNGWKDIDKTIVHEPMSIAFSDSIELLEVEVLKSPGKVNVYKENNRIICSWDLLKKKEFIVIKVLLRNKQPETSITSSELLKKHSKIQFRITDLSDAKKINYNKSVTKKIDYTAFIQPLTYFIVAVLMIVLLSVRKSYFVEYSDNYFDGQYYSIQASDDTHLQLECNKNKEIVSLKDYNNKESTTKIRIVLSKSKYIVIIPYVFILLLSIVMFSIEFSKIREDKRVQTFFEENEVDEKLS